MLRVTNRLITEYITNHTHPRTLACSIYINSLMT